MTPSSETLSWQQFVRTRTAIAAAFLALAAVVATVVPDGPPDVTPWQLMLTLIALGSVAIMASRDPA